MDDYERSRAAFNEKAIASFPFPRLEVHGKDALSAWQQLKSKGRGAPVILGDDDSVARIMEWFHPTMPGAKKSADDILASAGRLQFPGDLLGKRSEDLESGRASIAEMLTKPDSELPKIYELLGDDGTITGHQFGSIPDAVNFPDIFGGKRRLLSPDETRAFYSRESTGPAIGDWPAAAPESPGLSVAMNIMTGEPLEKVHIALIPTTDWTTIPAHLCWGGWNECPGPEYHVAAMRSWRDRYGAELIGFNFDTINLRVTRKPATRDEAFALAREQYAYCNDLIDQGVQTYSALAASLMADEWRYFWWD